MSQVSLSPLFDLCLLIGQNNWETLPWSSFVSRSHLHWEVLRRRLICLCRGILLTGKFVARWRSEKESRRRERQSWINADCDQRLFILEVQGGKVAQFSLCGTTLYLSPSTCGQESRVFFSTFCHQLWLFTNLKVSLFLNWKDFGNVIYVTLSPF